MSVPLELGPVMTIGIAVAYINTQISWSQALDTRDRHT